MTKAQTIITLLILLLLGAAGAGGYVYYNFSKRLTFTENQLASSTEKVAMLEEQLSLTEEANRNLREQLDEKREQVEEFSDMISDLTGDIDTIKKVQNTDPELLKKYSRVFFLNENYWPSGLDKIPDEWVDESQDEEEHFHENAISHLEDMLEDAEDDGIDLRIISAFRSFQEQQDLKSHYDVVYGQGTANQFSASQGYSEHQLGTTVDLTTKELSANFTLIDQTEAYEWLQDNAYKYGFVLSYPEENEHYQFEPWHWRFVGEDLAEHLHDEDLTFYEMDQREIDEYRADLFE